MHLYSEWCREQNINKLFLHIYLNYFIQERKRNTKTHFVHCQGRRSAECRVHIIIIVKKRDSLCCTKRMTECICASRCEMIFFFFFLNKNENYFFIDLFVSRRSLKWGTRRRQTKTRFIFALLITNHKKSAFRENKFRKSVRS